MQYKFYLLKQLVLILAAISFVIHLPRIYIDQKHLFLKGNLNNGEDKYHQNINKKKKSSRIISWTSYEMTDDEWDTHIKQFKIKAIQLVKDNINIMKDFTEKNIIFKKKKNEIKSLVIDSDKAICIWINKKKKMIRTTFDHEFCGGYFFIQYAALLCNGEPALLPIVPVKIPFIVESQMVKLLCKKPYEPLYKKYNLVTSTDDINRLSFTLNCNDKVSGSRTKIWILWKVINFIMQVDKAREGLDILMPIAFNKLDHIYNNIGVIFIKYKRGDTIEMLKKEVEEKQSMVLASNYYLRTSRVGADQGKNVRNNVDIVFTSSYVKNSNMTGVKQITTYNKIADYAIYCFTATANNNIVVTLTLNTKDIPIKNLLDKIPESKSV